MVLADDTVNGLAGGAVERADLICVGGGLAGLVAAARASELGLRAVVLEQGTEADYACNSRYSAGIFHASYKDLTLPPAQLREAMLQAGASDFALVDAMADNAGRALDWMRAQGVKFMHTPVLSRGAWVMAPPRPVVSRMEWRGRGPDVTLRTLTRQIEQRGGRVMRSAKVIALTLNADRCSGVAARLGNAEQRLDAAAVVLADGGFAGNAELFRAHIGPHPEAVLQRGAGTGLGDGLRMAQDAGAAIVNTDRFYGHLLSRDAMRNSDLWPYPQIDQPASAGIVVGADGRRIYDEGLGGIYASNAIAALSDPLGATVIVDEAIWESAAREGQVPPNPTLEKCGGTIHRAASIPELARLAGVHPDALATTIDEYNRAVATGALGALAPARSEGRYKAQPVQKAPFIAIPICVGITNTMGGVVVDAASRVLRRDGSSIAGLYAAGSTIGSLEGGPTAAYVGGLLKAVVFGLLAAESAAALIGTNARGDG